MGFLELCDGPTPIARDNLTTVALILDSRVTERSGFYLIDCYFCQELFARARPIQSSGVCVHGFTPWLNFFQGLFFKFTGLRQNAPIFPPYSQNCAKLRHGRTKAAFPLTARTKSTIVGA
eukprot:SAG31_NODE_3700_length_3975_cov_36.979102_3_plen_120_part_00